MITEAGASRVLAMDLHSGQCVGYFDIPVCPYAATVVPPPPPYHTHKCTHSHTPRTEPGRLAEASPTPSV